MESSTGMTLPLVHTQLAVTATWFTLLVGVWALLHWIFNRPLSPSWFGALIIAELLLIVQAILGMWLYMGMGLGGALPRPFIHILYGVVAVITIPAAWGYFGNLPEERVKSLAMAFALIFLWGIVLRAGSTAQYVPPGL